MTLSINKIVSSNITLNTTCTFGGNASFETAKAEQKANTKLKTASIAGSFVGVASALVLILKKRGIKLPNNIKNSSEIINLIKQTEFKGKDVITTATSSIVGGYIFGSFVDKENKKAKAKEGVVQLIGNYIAPTVAVEGGIKLNKALNKKYHFPPATKPIQFMFGALSLIGGVIAGNKISRGINKNIYKEENYRKLNWKDWASQFDNACLVTTICNEGTKLAKNVSKVIPIAHLAPGYQVGIKKNDYIA